MLSSTFLDTAIGIIFVFLLLSLIASTINEIILSFLSMRGKMLLRGIATLLNDENLAGLVPEIYKQGKIYGLYQGDFTASVTDLKKWWLRGKTVGNLPSYIPSGSFASAFLGVMMDKASPEARAALDAARQAAMTAMTNAKTASQQASLVLNDPNSTQAQKDSARAGASAAQAAATTADLTSDMQVFHTLRLVADGLGNNKVAQPLIAMLATADDDLNKLKSAVETWYDSAMDRVSGWYKYHTQWMLFWIGLVIAVALNANTVEIAKQISQNDTLRQSLVNAAASAPRPAQRVPSQGQQTSDTAKTAPATDNTTGASSDNAGTAEQGATGNEAGSSGANAATDLPNKYKVLAQQISEVKGLGLPLGWGNVEMSTRWWAPFYWAVGWLLTAVAVSLGAPFWFDLLNKFMVVRSTVKPHEKSKEEGSKD